MNKAIRELAAICKEHRFDEKLLFVPSYAIGHQLGEFLAKSGHAWINLRPTTVSGFAQELVGPDLAKNGIRLLDQRERLLIVEEIFRRDEKLNGTGSYFAGASGIPGILKCLADSIHELGMEGLGSATIDPGCFLVRKKGKAFRSLLTAYEEFLAENQLTDEAGLITMACKLLEDGKASSPENVVMLFSNLPLSGIEKHLVRLVGGNDLIFLGRERVPELRYPKRFSGDDSAEKSELEAIRTDVELLPFVYTPEDAPPPLNDGTVSLFHALGESNEVREVLRRVIGSGIPFDDVEIVLTKRDPYVSLIYEIVRSLDLPTSFSGGIPITYSRPGRGLILFLYWQMEDFLERHLRQLFEGGYLDLGSMETEGRIPASGRIASMLREAGIGWGRDRTLERIASLRASYIAKAEEKRADDKEEQAIRAEEHAAQAEGVLRYVRDLLDTVPFASPKESASLSSLCKGAIKFVTGFCRVAGELDGAAKSAILDVLETISRSPSVEEQAEDVCARVIRVVEEMTIGGSNPKPGHIHIGNYRSCGFSGRGNTFLLGLDQARFPGPILQDPIILDRERERLGGGLLLSHERIDEDVYTMANLLSSLKGRVTLSYSCRDLHEDREIFPSPLLLGVYRLISGNREGDYSSLKNYLGRPVGFSPDERPLNDWEWWLAQKEKYGKNSVFAAYPSLKSGVAAEAGREKEELTEYDGWLPSSEGSMDPLKEGVALSCSRLESLARCPFAYFIQYVLGVEPLEEVEKDMLRWLYPLQKGQLLHEVFHLFMAELVRRGERPSVKKHTKMLEEIAMKAIERWKAEVPPAGEFSFEKEREDILLTLDIFLRDEEERCSSAEPLFLELSFGLGGEEGVKIDLGDKKSFTLRGRIDRVDCIREHEYEVWDYKTGSSYGYKEQGYLDGCKHLQHALYGLAAESILRKRLDKKARVVRSGYFFPSPRGEGMRIAKPQDRRERVYEALRDLIALLQTGTFPACCDGDPCGFCDFAVICGGKDIAVWRSKKKLGNDSRMAFLERVMNHA
jgi:RecB family exonuclease